MPTQPTHEQIEALANHPGDGPVVMLNVLRFKKDGGEAAYAKIGAKPIYMGSFDSTVIGDFDETFDSIALVQYPNRQSFLDMIASEEYQAAHVHRDDGLESQWLLAGPPCSRAEATRAAVRGPKFRFTPVDFRPSRVEADAKPW